MNNNTARNFAVQLGSLITLYVSLVATIFIIFGVINVLFPDAASGYWEYDSTQQSIRIGIAMLVVFFPAFLVLTRMTNQIRRKEDGSYLTLTKWIVYLSLLVGGGVLLGDFVTVILTYLNGEVTARFILKATALAAIVGATLYYYIMDARGYWNENEFKSKLCGFTAIAIALVTLVFGFANSEAPTVVREMKIDAQQINDLSDMQWRIEDHYRVNKSLPTTTAALYIGIAAPKATEGRDSYTYKTIDTDTYELCATFLYSSNTADAGREIMMTEPAMKNPYNNWDHGAGKTCFERTIVKEQFPVAL